MSSASSMIQHSLQFGLLSNMDTSLHSNQLVVEYILALILINGSQKRIKLSKNDSKQKY
jgi:hypothetical protein